MLPYILGSNTVILQHDTVARYQLEYMMNFFFRFFYGVWNINGYLDIRLFRLARENDNHL